MALETYNQLAEAKPRTGPRSGPRRALGVGARQPSALWAWCSRGSFQLSCCQDTHLICLRQAVLSPNPAGRKSRSQAEDKIQSQKNVATAHKQAPLGVSKKEGKKNIFFRDQSSLSTFKTAAQFHMMGDSSLIASKIVYAALLF